MEADPPFEQVGTTIRLRPGQGTNVALAEILKIAKPFCGLPSFVSASDLADRWTVPKPITVQGDQFYIQDLVHNHLDLLVIFDFHVPRLDQTFERLNAVLNARIGSGFLTVLVESGSTSGFTAFVGNEDFITEVAPPEV